MKSFPGSFVNGSAPVLVSVDSGDGMKMTDQNPSLRIMESPLPPLPRSDGKTPYIYFLQRDYDGLIKIGFSTVPDHRCSVIAYNHACRVELLHWCPGGRALERHYHEMFADEWVTGEWFSPSERLMDCIYRWRKQFEVT